MKRINTNPHIVSLRFKRNENFPNSRLPVLIYEAAFQFPMQKNKASVIAEKIFSRNGWSNSWRNGIYDFHHYHSNTHECMAICAGKAIVIIGGPKGKRIKLESGSLLILPAGVGHKCVKASDDFLCVGAYPQGMDYDMNKGTAKELKTTLKKIKDVPLPKKDPVFGKQGFLKLHWE